jgi:TP901 family phage tail tape measure protein
MAYNNKRYIPVEISFSADTKQAQQQILDLKKSLQEVGKLPGKATSLFDDAEIKAASQAAVELQQHLSKAVNVNTGKLDLSRLSASLKASGKDLATYADQLNKVGPEGQKAFQQLTSAIASADAPVARINKRMGEFLTTLKNTVKWQITSGLTHGLASSIQSAYNYAEDLNKSLNNIRIVSGESTEQMAAFAKQANEAARALSATTLAYTDASLIFYQQGLSGEEVTERTNAVIKMSNVTGESVADVASYMTSIWNNFDGTYDRLEKYADIITALGAATASSSEEIAGGLEQFAAVAETVGLSYEYAASALATVVATTRQSESVVGNAFRTIFSRLQGLSLGDTLEDGVDLNKYSKALKAVGVDILDVTGNVKDLDTILDDLADKWDNLSEAQQVALAQTVGGARQYAQLISLMDNWDFMEENLATSRNSDGALQEQADIYAESWEAARKRVQAAAQSLYADLINDEFFIKILNVTEKIIKAVETLIEKMGGLKGVLFTIGGVFMTQYAKEMPNTLNNLRQNIMVFTGQGAKEAEKLSQEAQAQREKVYNDPNATNEDKARADADVNKATVQQAMLRNANKMTAAEREAYEIKLNNLDLMNQENIAQAKKLDLLKQQTEELKNQFAEQKAQEIETALREYEEAVQRVDDIKQEVMPSGLSKKEQRSWNANHKRELKEAQREENRRDKALDKTFKDWGYVYNGQKPTREEFINGASSLYETQSRYGNFTRVRNNAEAGFSDLRKRYLDKNKTFNSESAKTALRDLMYDIRDQYSRDVSTTFDRNGQAMNLQSGVAAQIKKLKNINTQEDFEKVINSIEAYFKGGPFTDAIEQALFQAMEQATKIVSDGGPGSSKVAEQYGRAINEQVDAENEQRDREDNARHQAEDAARDIDRTDQDFRGISDQLMSFGAAGGTTWAAAGQTLTLINDVLNGNASGGGLIASLASIGSTGVASFGMINQSLQKLSDNQLSYLKSIPALGKVFSGTAGIVSFKLMAIVAALKLIQVGVKAWVQAQEEKTLESQLERVSDAVKTAAEAYEKAAQKAEDFKNATSDFKTATNEIKELEQGTNAYKESIEKANEKARELIETYKLFGKYHYTDEGLIEFNDGALEEAQTEYNKQKYEKDAFSSYNEGRQAALNIKSFLDSFPNGFSGFEKSDYAEATNNLKGLHLTASQLEEAYLRSQDSEKYPNYNYSSLSAEENMNLSVSEAEMRLAAESFQLLGSNALKVKTDLVGYLEQTEDQVEQVYLAQAKNAQAFEDNLNAQQAYANLKSLEDVQNSNGLIKQFKEGQNITDEELIQSFKDNGLISAIGYSRSNKINYTDEDLIKDYARFIQGWTEDQLANATYSSDENGKGTLTASDGTSINNVSDASMREELYGYSVSQGIINSFAEDQQDSVKTLVNTILDSDLLDSEKNNAFTALKNVTQNADGTYAIEIDEANISPEARDKMLENLKNGAAGSVQEALYKAYQDYDEDKYWEAREAEQSLNLDKQIEKNELDTSDIKTQAELLQETEKLLKDNANAAKQLAVNNARMNKGLETLVDNWEDWSKVLKANDKTTTEYAETINDLRDVLADLSGLTKDQASTLSDSFIQGNLDLIEKAAGGDLDSINQLGFKAGEEIVNGLQQSITELKDEKGNLLFYASGLDESDNSKELEDKFKNAQSNVLAGLEILKNATLAEGQAIQDVFGEGAQVSFDSFVEGLNILAQQAGMTVEEMNGLLSSMNLEANVTTIDVPTYDTLPTYRTTVSGNLSGIFSADGNGEGSVITTTELIDSKQIQTGSKQVAAIGYGEDPKYNINHISKGGVSSGNKAKIADKGSSSKPSQKDHKDKINEEAELFHNVKESISDLEHAMNKLSKAQDHLAGGALISALKQENDYLENQIELYGQYNDEIDERQNFLTSELSSFGDPEDYYGTYQSIEDAYNKAIDDYNAVVDKYNAMSKDEQEASGDTMLDNAEDVLNDAKEAYDQANEDLKEYYSNKDLIRQNEEKKLEALYNQIENNLKAFEVQLELDLDIEDAQRTINDFINKTQKDFKKVYTSAGDWSREFTTSLKNATSYSNTIATDLQAIQDVKDIIDDEDYDYLSSDSMFGSQSEAIQYLEELEKTVMEDGESLYDLYSTAWDSYLSAMDDVVSQWEDIIDDFDEINDTLDHYQKIAELLYGGDEVQAGRDYLDQIYTVSAQNSLAKQSTLAQEIEALGKERAELLAAGADEADQDIQKIDEAIQSANQELQSEIESYVDTIQNQFTNAIASIMAAADKTLFQGYGLETLSERWQKAQDAAEGYYDDVERIFELESLESKWEDLINSTSTLKNQQYLKTIMDAQLQNLQNKTKLSEYDIGLAEKELAIYQAQIALEEAQNSKNTMKLMRNEAGNWTYNYVADDDDVADKQESLLTSLQDKYEYVKSASEEATEQVLELYQTAQEELTALMEEYKIADETRRAELEGEYEYLYNYYYGVDGLIVQKTAEANQMQQDLNTATMESTWGLYEVDQDNFQIMTENEQALIEELRDNSIESLRGLLETVATDDGSFYNQMQEKCAEVCADSQGEWKSLANDIIATWAEDPDSVRATVTNAYDEIMGKVADYDEAIAESEQASKQSWSNINDAVNDVTGSIGEVLGKVNEVEQSTSQLDNFRKAVAEIGDAWGGVSRQIQTATSDLRNYLALLNQGADFDGDTYTAGWDESTSSRGTEKSKSTASTDGGSGDGGTSVTPQVVESLDGNMAQSEGYYSLDTNEHRSSYKTLQDAKAALNSLKSVSANSPEFKSEVEDAEVIKVTSGLDSRYYIVSDKKGNFFKYRADSSWGKSILLGFDTGGYTGDWSDGNGKLAMLHSKEIVLNKEDTANLLSAVESVRSITSLGSNIASSISSGIASLIGKMLNFNNNLGSIGTTTTPAAENNNVFNINAEFPNANNAEEIREAIMSLPTLASQYLSQKVL